MITCKDIHENKDLAISLHREMWNWLADNPSKDKKDWPRWRKNGGDIEHCFASCFMCEYASAHSANTKIAINCHICPLAWPSFLKDVRCENICFFKEYRNNNKFSHGLFRKLFQSLVENPSLHERISHLSRVIANLPERPLPLRIWKTHVVWNSRSFFTEERCIKSTCLLCSANTTNYCKHGISTISDPVNYEITASCSLFRLKSAYEGNINVLN